MRPWARVPDPRPGVATVVSRYRRERAVLLHPDDFHRLDAIEALVAEAARVEPAALSSAAIDAHRAGPAPIVDAARNGMSEFVVLAPVKARPVLVISPVLAPNDEVLALRLRRMEKIDDEAARERVRSGHDDGLLWLRPESFTGLPVENAAIVSSLLRLPIAAIDRRESLGALNDVELASLHERVVRAHGLRLDNLVLERAQRLVDAARSRGA